MDKREQVGVSEIYGYILLFGMIAFLLSVIYMEAMPRINDYENYANFKVMEGEFLVLKDIFLSASTNVTPEKVVNLNVKRGVVYTEKVGNISFDSKNYDVNALVYRMGNDRIYLVLGTVVECFGNDCIAVTKPPFLNGSRSYVRIVNVSGSLAFSGLKQILIKNEGCSRSVKNVASVNITFEDDGLLKAFKRSLDFNVQQNGKTLEISLKNGIVTFCNVSVR